MVANNTETSSLLKSDGDHTSNVSNCNCITKTSSYGGASLKSKSPANSPSIGKGTRISSTGNLRRASRRRDNNDADDGSIFSSFTSTSKPIISRQSFVLAPDDLDLPPQTRKLFAKYLLIYHILYAHV